jgi:hypothetical protein
LAEFNIRERKSGTTFYVPRKEASSVSQNQNIGSLHLRQNPQRRLLHLYGKIGGHRLHNISFGRGLILVVLKLQP